MASRTHRLDYPGVSSVSSVSRLLVATLGLSFRPSSGPPAEERFRRGLEALIAIGLIASVPIVYRIVFVKLLLTEVLWPSFVAVVTDAINEGREEREREAREKREAVENATTLRHDDATKKILVDLVQSSKNQAQRILQRAGVYLIIGSLIAFFGVGFFLPGDFPGHEYSGHRRLGSYAGGAGSANGTPIRCFCSSLSSWLFSSCVSIAQQWRNSVFRGHSTATRGALRPCYVNERRREQG